MTATTHLVVETPDFDAALEHLQGLGLRIDRISPADSPREADLSLGDLLVRLALRPDAAPVALDLDTLRSARSGADPGWRTVPGHAPGAVEVPDGTNELVISRIADSDDFGVGRAGMGYRDLIPGRLGGRFIASHIRIEAGGPVPDYAHYHRIRFQMIFCYRGWVRVAYEDQGEPFVLRPGDGVLQPPEIRHRVLESSPGLEVIEVGCPAEHDTFADHDITLPTGVVAPDRDFGGQRFVRHVAEGAPWHPWRHAGFSCRRTGIAEATDGLAGVRVVRAEGDAITPSISHDAELQLLFVLDGDLELTIDGAAHALVTGDSVVIPSGATHVLSARGGTELLEVTLPAEI